MRRFVLFLEVWAIVALMLALPTPALAQTAPAETPSPTAYTDSVQGIEFSEGTVVDDTRFGASFAGQATGELPGYLVASTDYTPPSPGPDVTNNIVGGGWTLLGERGTIFGSFTGGAVRWNTDGTLAEVVADMSVLGGSVDGTTIPSSGTGTFSGMLDHTPLARGFRRRLTARCRSPCNSGSLPRIRERFFSDTELPAYGVPGNSEAKKSAGIKRGPKPHDKSPG